MKLSCSIIAKAKNLLLRLESPLWIFLKELSVGILAYILVVHVFLITAPFLLYRKLATFVATRQDKDISRIVTGLSAMFHRDFDCLQKKSMHTIVACLRIKRGTSLTLSGLQEAFLNKVIGKRDRDGKIAYPELQQHYTRFMGYSFLKWDRKFDIENHVIAYHNENNEQVVVNRPDLTDIWQDLMEKGFHKERSPWEAILIENYVGEEGSGEDWIIMMRIHHGIVDGFCFEHILSSLFESDYVPDFSQKNVCGGAERDFEGRPQKMLSQVEKILLNLRCGVLGPYDLFNRSIRFAEDYHTLHLPARDKSNRYFVVESPLIQVAHLKTIKQSLGLGFTTILMGIAAGAVRKFLLRSGAPFPERCALTIPFPSPETRRRDNLGNNFLLAGLDLPIHLEDQQARLRHVQKSLENLRYSSFMKMLNIIFNQITNFPSPILRAVTSKSVFSITYSTIPGPDKIVTCRTLGGGSDLIEANFTHGLSPDSLGLGISSITFAGNVRMTVFVDRNLMGGDRDKAEQLVKDLLDEYHQLFKFVQQR